MRLSVVIPTWNEELWLPRLLRCLVGTDDIDEVIVVDNESEDATVCIANAHGCKVVSGGRPGKARNIGARASRGDAIMFVDADVIVDSATIDSVMRHFANSKVVAAHCRLEPIFPTPFIRLCYAIMDCYFSVVSYIGFSQGVGSFLVVRKEAFFAVDGFRENVAVGEDADLYRRLASIGKVKYDRRVTVYASARRFLIENPLVFATKCILWAALRLCDTTASGFKYKWLPYPDLAAKREEPFVWPLLESRPSEK